VNQTDTEKNVEMTKKGTRNGSNEFPEFVNQFKGPEVYSEASLIINIPIVSQNS